MNTTQRIREITRRADLAEELDLFDLDMSPEDIAADYSDDNGLDLSPTSSGFSLDYDYDTADDLAYAAGVADGYYRFPMAQSDVPAYVDGHNEGSRMYAAEFGR